MKSNKICSKLRKGANFAAANLPLRPQKPTTGDGSGRWARENEILRNFMLQGSQSTGKYTTPECSYILKCTSYLAPLAYMLSPIHAVLVIITGWHNQPHFTLLPTPRPQASFPSPTHYYLARHWCSGARNAMNLVCRKSEITENTDLGTWDGDKGSRETGVDCLAVSPRSERSGKRPTLEGQRGNEREGRGQIALV